MLIVLKGIEVKFKNRREKYPVSIKAKFGDQETYKSKQYGENESAHWLCERYALATMVFFLTQAHSLDRKLAPDSHLKIAVREHHNFYTTEMIVVRVSVPELLTKPFLEAGKPFSPRG